MRRVTVAMVLLVASGLVSTSSADTPEEIFNQANAAYEKGSYQDAAEGYKRVIQYGVIDARVEYNLGNASFKLGRLGDAVLHFEKALRLAPTDPDIAGNLELARSRCFDRVEPEEVAGPIRWIRSIQNRLGPDRQAVVALALVWIAAGIVSFQLARPGRFRAAAGWSLAAAFFAAAVVTLSWYSTYERLEGTHLAVVLGDAVDVLAGPGQNNASLFTVHEGLTLEVRAERQEWVQVSLPNGLHGWIPRDAIGFV